LGDSTWQFERAVSGVAKAAHELRESSIARDWSVRTIAARLRTASRNEAATTVKVFEEYAPRLGESVPAALDLILRERDRLTPPEHPRRGRFLANLAWAALQMGRADEARALVEQATPADDDDREVIAAVREALEQQAGQKLDKGAGGEAPRSTGAK
jgi:hypothetical protein